ncbi:FliH/SctL family protein [Rhodoferax sp.]|jgi:flagellar assembly protein FliH|uniref:FliH/SctL family protein n=1 Tax=Rhodoferax sp. TaxID=50421 RepID=UPI0037846582
MSRNPSHFIPSDQVGKVSDWTFSAVDQVSVKFAAKLKAQAEAEEKSKSDAAHQAGYALGYTEGFAQGHAQATLEGQRHISDYIATQGQDAAAKFLRRFATASDQLQAAEQDLAQGVLELACELSRQVLRHELATNPNALLPVVREALGLLASDSKAAAVRLNPVDLEVVSQVLQAEFPHLGLRVMGDAAVQPGGCLVESAGTVVDGTVERRWQRAVASLGLESAWEPDHDGN